MGCFMMTAETKRKFTEADMSEFMIDKKREDASLYMNSTTIVVVDAPEISLTEDEKAGEVLLKFFRALGWNGEDYLDPCKIRTTKAVFDQLYAAIFERCLDPVGVGMLMINSGPSTDNFVPPNKVYLYEGWVKSAETKESV